MKKSILFMGALSITLGACVFGNKKKERGKGALPVIVTDVEKKVHPRIVKIVAPLIGKQQVDIFSKVSGRLSFLALKENEKVRKDQVIARVDRSDPSESFLTTPIVSPINGWLARWFVTSLGEQVSPNAAIATVVDDSALIGHVYLTSENWLEITYDTEVKVTVNSATKPAKIKEISRAAENNTGRGVARFELDNADHSWRAGMIADAEILLSPKPRMIVPASAILMTDAGPVTYVIDQDKALRKNVKIDLISQDQVEVLEGLEEKSKLVTIGANLLFDQATVKIVEPTTVSKAEAKDNKEP